LAFAPVEFGKFCGHHSWRNIFPADVPCSKVRISIARETKSEPKLRGSHCQTLSTDAATGFTIGGIVDACLDREDSNNFHCYRLVSSHSAFACAKGSIRASVEWAQAESGAEAEILFFKITLLSLIMLTEEAEESKK
jgi:hypothetical protein